MHDRVPPWFGDWRYPPPSSSATSSSSSSNILSVVVIAAQKLFGVQASSSKSPAVTSSSSNKQQPPHQHHHLVSVRSPPHVFSDRSTSSSDDHLLSTIIWNRSDRSIIAMGQSASSSSLLDGGDPSSSANGGVGGNDHQSPPYFHMAPTPDPADVLFTMFGLSITGEKLTYASVVLCITVLLIVTSLLTIIAIVTSETLKDVIGHYLVSLAVTDLLIGTLVTPLAFYAALDENWRYARNEALWKIQSYLEITLWSTTVYIFMWIGVDRFAALTKPSRYEVEQTFTRCKCWIVFTWVTSALSACPTLFGEMQANYYEQAFVCILDWSAMAPYSVTLGVLVIVPSLVSVVYSYSFILRKLQNPEGLEDNQKALLETDTSYMMTFFVILTFVVSWLPWFALRAYETIFRHDLNSRPLHFCLLWLAIGGGNWKILIYVTMNPEFRKSLGSVYESICCACCSNRRQRYGQQHQSMGNHIGGGGNNSSRSSSQYTVIASSAKHNRFF